MLGLFLTFFPPRFTKKRETARRKNPMKNGAETGLFKKKIPYEVGKIKENDIISPESAKLPTFMASVSVIVQTENKTPNNNAYKTIPFSKLNLKPEANMKTAKANSDVQNEKKNNALFLYAFL